MNKRCSIDPLSYCGGGYCPGKPGGCLHLIPANREIKHAPLKPKRKVKKEVTDA